MFTYLLCITNVALSLRLVMHATSFLFFYSKSKVKGRPAGSKNKGKEPVRGRAPPKKSRYTVPLLGDDDSAPAHTSSPTIRRKTPTQASTSSTCHDTDGDSVSDYSSANIGKNLL